MWQETEEGSQELIWETPTKPVGDELERILSGETDMDGTSNSDDDRSKPLKKAGFLTGIQRFLNALNQ